MKRLAPTWPAVVLGLLGIAQMAGDLLDVRELKGIAAATAASPAPKVFSAVRGFETYTTGFFVEYVTSDGRQASVQITSELYARLQGPYNRRNVYGAALSYGPVLPDELRTPVMRYALCGTAPLLRELQIEDAVGARALAVRYVPRPGLELGDLSLRIEAGCP